MQLARLSLVLVMASCTTAPKPQPTRSDSTVPAASIGAAGGISYEHTADGQSAPPVTQTSFPTSTADLTRERTLIDESEAARKASDYTRARAKAAEAVASLLARSDDEQDAAWLSVVYSAGVAAYSAQDARTANVALQRVADLRTRTLSDDHPDLQRTRHALAWTMYLLGDLQGARALQERVLAIQSRTLPDEHSDLQKARQNFAITIKALGDLPGARALSEKVLEVYSRTLPDDHDDLQAARQNLGIVLLAQRDLEGARPLFEKALEVLSRTLPNDHPHLQGARTNLAATIKDLGNLEGARAQEEQVLEVFSRTLPGDHPSLQTARQNLAVTLRELGDLQSAYGLFEQVLEVRLRILPADHPDLQLARGNLAVALRELGHLSRARALQEQVLDVLSRTLPGEHPDVLRARHNLAGTMYQSGDLAGARALFEQVLEIRSRTLADDHPDVQKVRLNIAQTIKALGDLAGAQALEEQVLEVRSRALPDDHPQLQSVRLNLAVTLKELGDYPSARELFEQVLEIRSRTLADDHPDLQAARWGLGVLMYSISDFRAARAQFEQVFEVLSRTLPEDHADLQGVRVNLGVTMHALGDFTGARALFEHVLEVFSRTLPHDHPDLQAARYNLAGTILDQSATSARESDAAGQRRLMELQEWRDKARDLLAALSHAQARTARAVRLSTPGREAEERCASLTESLDTILSAALGYRGLTPFVDLQSDAFTFAESTRNAAISSGASSRMAAESAHYGESRARFCALNGELVRLAQNGTTSADFQRALSEREAAERELIELGREFAGGKPTGIELSASNLSTALEKDEVAVAYRRFVRATPAWASEEQAAGPHASSQLTESLCAFVVQSHARSISSEAPAPMSNWTLKLVDLGPIEPIVAAVDRWRAGLGVATGRGLGVMTRPPAVPMDESGIALRRLILDPLVAEIQEVRRVILVLDDVLHLVPFDALPSGGGGSELLGDVFRIETRATLSEILDPSLPLGKGNEFVGLGGVLYGGESEVAQTNVTPALPSGSASTLSTTHNRLSTADILRGSLFEAGFPPLPSTRSELEGVRGMFAKVADSHSTLTLLSGAGATRQALLERAPYARWLHIATHGWINAKYKSWDDATPIETRTGLALRRSSEETVKGLSPMLLCGLALADANLPENAVGRPPGLITADELSTLDLSNCELAVLSACDTARGEIRRAGQGVASLQKALQTAGARSVITSLWKVPDEATKELMLDFYRRLWVEKKPKWQALWEAKMLIRNAKDESGALKYTMRDWAAWVLTGDPN